MVHFAEINQAPSPNSMLQYIGRVAPPKLVPRNCLRYLQITLKMEGEGLLSEFIWGIVNYITCLLLLRMILHLHIWAVAWHENKFFSQLDKTTIHELWKLITFLICKTSLAITPHPPASLWRITYENRYVTHL